MKTRDFIYDGKNLSSFGFMICSFGSKGLDTISDGANITFNTVPVLGGSKNHLTSAGYEDCLEATIQICKASCKSDVKEISPDEHRQLTKWLSRKRFLKLELLDKEHEDLYYEAAFTSVSKIELDGALYGLELEITTNAPFAFRKPITTTVFTKKKYIWEKYNKTDDDQKGESTGEFVWSHKRDKYPDDGIIIYQDTDAKSKYYYVYVREENVASINDISHEEGYIYPYTEITVLENGDLNIHNAIENRDTYIADCIAGEIITMDYPIIQSSVSSHDIQNDFNWNFFRVANTYDYSRNDLTTSIPCEIKITYSPIVKIGL
jgi:hypothetical protein